jgi:hypothetical protein
MKYQMQPALLSEALGDRTGAGTNDVDFLLLIGGGSYQPWGAGVLRGWHDNPENPRPKFQVVFGVNSGAVVATYAFLGERSDDDALEGMCLTGPDSFQAKPFTLPLVSDSIGSSSPLQQAITRYISPATLERVAKAGREEHRRLYVATVNMDSGRLVIWDLTSVAMDESNPARLALYRRIALASASLPILAPPVEIDGYFHADAGPRAGLCFEQFLPSILRWQRSELIHPPFTLHLILNGKLEAGSAPIGDSLKEISFRTLELLVDANKIEALYSVKRALASARYGKFQFCYVPQDLPVTGLGVLRQSSPRMLYDAGVAFGKRTRKMESLIPP